MAITFTQLAADPDTSNTNSYATPSISPTASRLLLAVVLSSRGGSADPDTPTLAGNGLTWAHVDDGVNQGNNLFESTGSLRTRLCLFFALTGGSPSAGAVTASFTNNCTGCSIIVVQSNEEVDLADPIIQVKLASGTGATSGTLSMDPFGDANNATFSCWGLNGDAGGITHEGTELADIAYATPARETQAQYLATADTSPGISWSGANTFGGIGVEIGLAVGAPIEKDLTPATETDGAQALSITKTIFKTLTPATSADAAQTLSFTKTIFKTLTPAAETDVAVALSIGGVNEVDLTAATETDAAQALSFTKTIFKTLAPAASTGQAQPLSLTKTIFKTLTPTAETDTAQALSFSQAGAVTLSPAVEVDQAQQLSITKTIFKTLGIAVENDVAASLTFTGGGVQPTTAHYDQPTPSGGTDGGTPGAAHFDQPHPGKVLV